MLNLTVVKIRINGGSASSGGIGSTRIRIMVRKAIRAVFTMSGIREGMP